MKKIIKYIYLFLLYACFITVFTFLYSFFSKQVFFSFLFSIPYIICFVILTIVSILLLKHVKKCRIIPFILVLFITIYTVLIYFPFLHILPNIEENLVLNYFSNDISPKNRDGDWQGINLVAHGLGAINDIRMATSIEAFQLNYQDGYRVFEVDFTTTSDGYLVCRHLWEDPDMQTGIDENHIPTLEVFKSTKVYDQYTPMSFSDLCLLLKEYPDAWIITDSKETNSEAIKKEFENMVKEAKEIGCEDVLNRFVLQFYDEEMYQTVTDIYPFKNSIYATYMYWHGDIVSFAKICDFCYKNNIDSISMWNYYYCDEIQDMANRYGLDIYIHTINDISTGEKYLSMGAKGIYSDFIKPNELENQK